MLTFFPEFEAAAFENMEIVFLLDLSNSMNGAVLVEAKKILLLTLRSLPENCSFNIVTFGTGYEILNFKLCLGSINLFENNFEIFLIDFLEN